MIWDQEIGNQQKWNLIKTLTDSEIGVTESITTGFGCPGVAFRVEILSFHDTDSGLKHQLFINEEGIPFCRQTIDGKKEAEDQE